MTTIRLHHVALVALAVVAGLPAEADAANWKIEGRGFGHGVGMSQYGAYGFAKKGKTYEQILRHYYTGVDIGRSDTRSVRVLIATGLGSLEFSEANKACGKDLNKSETYSFQPHVRDRHPAPAQRLEARRLWR